MSSYADFDLADARRDYWAAVDARTDTYEGPERRHQDAARSESPDREAPVT